MAQYQVTTIWWPAGWEPGGPSDVPNCIGRAPEQDTPAPVVDLKAALATVRALNRQNMDHPGSVWYVVAEVGDGPTGGDVPAGDVPAGEDGLRVVRSAEGIGRGDCSHCPAASFPCAAAKAT